MAFEKGKSGNPGGRPKENDELKELAREHTAEAINRIVFWMRSDEPKASLTASMALLDRGHGKPIQATELSGPNGAPLTSGVIDIDTVKSLAYALRQLSKENVS
jgi:hypothetical protein